MSGILKVDTVRNVANTVNLPMTALKRRVVQRYTRWFKGGLWNPSNQYREIPGCMMNITPMYSDSIIIYTCMIPLGHRGDHPIHHWIFYANGQEYARHGRGQNHQEEGSIHRWEVPSWGKGASGTIGYLVRQYSDSNHSVHFNGRRYIDGSDSSRGVPNYVSVEEYVPV